MVDRPREYLLRAGKQWEACQPVMVYKFSWLWEFALKIDQIHLICF